MSEKRPNDNIIICNNNNQIISIQRTHMEHRALQKIESHNDCRFLTSFFFHNSFSFFSVCGYSLLVWRDYSTLCKHIYGYLLLIMSQFVGVIVFAFFRRFFWLNIYVWWYGPGNVNCTPLANWQQIRLLFDSKLIS